MVFMIGWALGGILFGILGDRLGRAKTMMLTILCYTIFTGLSLFATSILDFSVYRFLCGLGVGRPVRGRRRYWSPKSFPRMRARM